MITGYDPNQSSYLFIDGDNLRVTIARIGERYLDGAVLPIDWTKLRGAHRKVFYYDAIPVQSRDEDASAYVSRVAPKNAELAALERQAGYHVRSGDAVHRKRRGNEQKMVDVQLAVDALSMASRGLFRSITLITGDLDFKPLISALVEMGIDVDLRYPVGETNSELLAAADSASPIMFETMRDWLDTSFTQPLFFPRSQSSLKTGALDEMPDIVKWDGGNYGVCRVFRTDYLDEFILQTSEDPASSGECQVQINAKTQSIMRSYAYDRYGLAVPEW